MALREERDGDFEDDADGDCGTSARDWPAHFFFDPAKTEETPKSGIGRCFKNKKSYHNTHSTQHTAAPEGGGNLM